MLCGAGQGVAHRLGLQRPRPESVHRRGHAAHVAEHGSVRRGAGEVTIPPISLKQTAATATCSPNAWTCARRSGTCRISPAGRFCACWAEPIRENHNKEKPHDKESKRDACTDSGVRRVGERGYLLTRSLCASATPSPRTTPSRRRSISLKRSLSASRTGALTCAFTSTPPSAATASKPRASSSAICRATPRRRPCSRALIPGSWSSTCRSCSRAARRR